VDTALEALVVKGLVEVRGDVLLGAVLPRQDESEEVAMYL
jgi:hypothetical protein